MAGRAGRKHVEVFTKSLCTRLNWDICVANQGEEKGSGDTESVSAVFFLLFHFFWLLRRKALHVHGHAETDLNKPSVTRRVAVPVTDAKRNWCLNCMQE
jgi:hypothetical protein